MGFFKLQECKNVLLQGLSASVDACESNCLVPVAANTTDAAKEKHVPAVTVDGDKLKVAVGSVIHPMEEDHYIEWVCLEYEGGQEFKWLKPGMEPVVEFDLNGRKPIAAYEFCNKHGLWKAEI